MKNKMRILGIIALTAVIVFTISVCDEGSKAQTVTYTGLGYTLKITENTNRAYSPVTGDNYELKANGKTSRGTVTVNDAVFTLKPSNSAVTFTITISGAAISAISGTITWNDNTATPVGGTLTITNFSSILTNTNNYVYAQALVGEDMVAFVFDDNPVPNEAKLGKIPASGSIVLNAYHADEGGFLVINPFTGNGIAATTKLIIVESTSNIWSSQFQFGETVIHGFENTVPITFTNGNATVNFSTQMELYLE